VSIITGGSPCQDLSVAGKRAGLAGERSGLFMEQIRLIKEMRENDRKNGRTDEHIRPRFMVWENVPGAFSSNKGEDFRAVLEETAKVAEGDACIPGSPNGKWPHAGCIMGDGWSIAWRVHDAQFWGVPQRRKRIALVADFGGGAAPEILFKPKSVSGHFEPCGEAGQGTAGDVENGIGDAIPINTMIATRDKQLGERTGFGIDESGAPAYTISAAHEHAVAYGICSYESNAMKSDNPNSGIYEADTSRTLDLNGGNPACNQGGMAVVQASGVVSKGNGDCFVTPEKHMSLSVGGGQAGQGYPCVCIESNGSRPSHKGDGYAESDTMYTLNGTEHHAVCVGNGQLAQARLSDKVGALNCMHDQQAVITYGLDRASFNQGINAKYDFAVDEEKIGTQVAKGPGAVCQSVVRRLTPLECERLQGFPDHWTDIGDWVDSKGKKHKGESDSPRYKALGNSIALPFWQWMAEKMVKYVDEQTMASLFDGIGGFPLVFSRCGCTPVWASEIEEFPIAVTKIRFPE
jgi:DNA (cytosine-5)-methyltransferase 1